MFLLLTNTVIMQVKNQSACKNDKSEPSERTRLIHFISSTILFFLVNFLNASKTFSFFHCFISSFKSDISAFIHILLSSFSGNWRFPNLEKHNFIFNCFKKNLTKRKRVLVQKFFLEGSHILRSSIRMVLNSSHTLRSNSPIFSRFSILLLFFIL